MKKDNRKYKLVLIVFSVALILVSFVMIAYENNYLTSEKEADGSKSAKEYLVEKDTVYIGGEAYLKKSDISTFLVIGVDTEGEMEEAEGYYNSAKADFIGLFVIDHDAKAFTLIQINRDTMTDVEVIGEDGKSAGYTDYEQIALAYTYGDGLEISCRNTVDAVEHLLYFGEDAIKREVDNYASVTMAAIPVINDSVGGVSLTLPEDYTEMDKDYVKGAEIKLNGDKALEFVRARGEMNTPTNIARMSRQELYLDALVSKASVCGLDEDDIFDLYDKLAPYMVTDCDERGISDVYSVISEYECAGIISPEGESVEGEEYMEYYADDEMLKELVIGLFFDKLR